MIKHFINIYLPVPLGKTSTLRSSAAFLISLIFMLILFINSSKAQSILSPEEAIDIALKNNYSLQVSKTAMDIAKNNFNFGNSGFLPQLGFNLSKTYGTSKINQEYASGLKVEKSDVNSNNLNTGISFNWTLFDGLKMFNTYNKLETLTKISDFQFMENKEDLVFNVLAAYYFIVEQKKYISLIQTNLNIYNEKIKIAELKLNLGSGSNLELLQAKVDLNAQKAALLKQAVNISNSRAELNKLLARDADIDFDVSDTIIINYNPTLADLKNSSASHNTGLNIYKNNIELSRYNSKDIVSQRYPKLSFLMNYNFTSSENQAGFSLLNSNLGFTRGFTLSYSLFDGFNNNIKLKNAKLGEQQALMLFNQVKTEVETALLKAFNTFTLNLQMLNLEEENIKISRENLNVALEKFRLGTISSLEFKEAQNSFESAYIRLINARYDTKLSEITLMKLNGDLAK